MQLKKFFLILLLSLLIFSCSKDEIKVNNIEQDSLDLQVLEAYEEGLQAIEGGDVLFAAKKFNEAEMLFPQSEWAPRSALMAAYAYYIQDYYSDSIAELERFLRVYPSDKNLDYAHYLLAICFFEQIVDEKKDMRSIIKSKEIFEVLVKKFPNTDYSTDASFKLDLINDVLASKEMYIGRYYLERKKWIASINRFRTVVDDYDTTIYTQEALHRLVEIYYTIGLKEEAEKYAQLLGYNYQSSKWYEKSFSLFDKTFLDNKKTFSKKDKKSNIVIRKFKSLFE